MGTQTARMEAMNGIVIVPRRDLFVVNVTRKIITRAKDMDGSASKKPVSALPNYKKDWQEQVLASRKSGNIQSCFHFQLPHTLS